MVDKYPKAGFFVEFHGWPLNPGLDHPSDPHQDSPYFPGGRIDVTEFCTACHWTEAVNAPWGGLQLEMVVPIRLMPYVFPGRFTTMNRATPAPPSVGGKDDPITLSNPAEGQIPEAGFWVVIGQTSQHADGPPTREAHGLYRCIDISGGVAANNQGHIETSEWHVVGETFLANCGRSAIEFSPQAGLSTWGAEGFVYQFKSWQEGMTELMGSVYKEPIGIVFEKLWATVNKIVLPPTLCGQPMGEVIAIVHNEANAAQSSPLRKGTIQEVPGYQLTSAAMPPRGTLLQLFQGLFGADPRFVEMFPSIEPYLDNMPASHLAQNLGGALPVVIYRLKPWIVKPLTAANVSEEVGEMTEKATAATTAQIGQHAIFTEPPYHKVGWFEFHLEDIQGVNFSWSESDRVNFMSASTCFVDQGNMTHGISMSPLCRNTREVQHHGLRRSEIHWPFFPNEAVQETPALTKEGPVGLQNAVSTGSVTDQVTGYANAIVELGWSIAAENERFCRGSATVEYRPWVKPGNWIRLYLDAMCLTAYIESISKSAVATGPQIEHYMVIAFSRGTLRYFEGSVARPMEYQHPLMTADLVPKDDRPAELDLSNLRSSMQKKANAAKTDSVKVNTKYGSLIKDPPEKKKMTVYWNKNNNRLIDLPAYDMKAIPKPLNKGDSAKYAADVKAYNDKKSAVTNGGRPKKHEYTAIVVHYTNTSTLKGMLSAFKAHRGVGKDDKTAFFYTGTNYSVDRNGVVYEWADPKKFYTNNAKPPTGTDDGYAIGVDLVLIKRQKPTTEQIRALAALIQYLRSQFPMIPPAAAPNDAVGLTKDEIKTGLNNDGPYGIFKHNAWSPKGQSGAGHTECCGPLVDLEAIVGYGQLDNNLQLVSGSEAASKAYLEEAIK